MSLELVRSHGMSIKTLPTGEPVEKIVLMIHRPDQDTLYFGLQRGLVEIEYTLHELSQGRGQDSIALEAFRRYLKSLHPKSYDTALGKMAFLSSPDEKREYTIPELSDTDAVDWCGVLIDPTDFLYASRYVITNIPVEPDDIRPAFLDQL